MNNEMFFQNERKEVTETSAPASAPKKESKPNFFARIWKKIVETIKWIFE